MKKRLLILLLLAAGAAYGQQGIKSKSVKLVRKDSATLYLIEELEIEQTDEFLFANKINRGDHWYAREGKDSSQRIAVNEHYRRTLDSFAIVGTPYPHADIIAIADTAFHAPGADISYCREETLISYFVYWNKKNETWKCTYDSLRKTFFFSKATTVSFYSLGEAMIWLLVGFALAWWVAAIVGFLRVTFSNVLVCSFLLITLSGVCMAAGTVSSLPKSMSIMPDFRIKELGGTLIFYFAILLFYWRKQSREKK